MGKAISNGDIFKKIGLLIYRDKLRIFIALIASVVSYYLTLYPTDRLNIIVDGITNGKLDFNGVLEEITKIIIAGVFLYIVYYFIIYIIVFIIRKIREYLRKKEEERWNS